MVATARELVDYLVLTYDVTISRGRAADDFPEWRDETAETIRLVPSRGVPLTLMFTDFPSVVVRLGKWGNLPGFPTCGCDACDESADESIEEFDQLVSAAVNGDYFESLAKRELSFGYGGAWGSRRNSHPLRRGQWKLYGDTGTRSWPRWPKRDS